MTTIYVLKLENDRYYVGKSNNPAMRYNQHVGGTGSAWTRKYKPISIEKTVIEASPFDEDKITKEYMLMHGIDNVRGGSYVTIVLSDMQLSALEMEMRTALDLCARCGRASHFIRDCLAEKPNNRRAREEILDLCAKCGQIGHLSNDCAVAKAPIAVEMPELCARCGRMGHLIGACGASAYTFGDMLDELGGYFTALFD